MFTLSEKRDFIDQDFKKSKLYRLGDIPLGNKEKANKFWDAAIHEAGVWIMRYRSSSDRAKAYAKEVLDEWMSDLEKQWKAEYMKEDAK